MAISLGDINFSLGADAGELQQSMARLRAFGKEAERVARSQAEGADKVAAAYRKQEASITSALQKTLNLNAAIRRAGGDTSMINQANRAFNLYANQLTSTAVKSLTLQRANERLAASLGTVKRELADLQQKRHDESTSRLAAAMHALQSTAVLVSGPLGGIATRLATLSTLMRTTSASTAVMVAGFGLTTLGAFKLGEAIVANARKINIAESAFKALTGSASDTSRLLNEARTIAQRSGQDFGTVATQYAKFEAAAQGTNLAGQKSAEIFETVAKVAGSLQLPAEQAEGIFRALEQMMSKGVIQAEELRGQLGDRLPGAFQIMARALRVTTPELNNLMKKGQVLADDVLPKFADELKKTFNIGGDVNNFQASINRLGNSWSNFLDALDKTFGVSDLVKTAIEGIGKALEWMTARIYDVMEANEAWQVGVAAGAAEFVKFGNTLASLGGSIVAGFTGMFGRIGELFTAFTADLSEFVTNPLDNGGFDKLSAVLDKGFVSSFTDAFNKVRAEGKAFNDAIDQEVAGRATASADKIAAMRAGRTAADPLGVGSPTGGSGGGGGGGRGDPKEAAKQAKSLADAMQLLSRANAEVAALTSGATGAMEQLQKQFEIDDKVTKFADLLKASGMAANQAKIYIDQYRTSLEQIDPLTKNLELQKAAMDELGSVASRSMDRIGGAIAEMTSSAKLSFSSFKSVLKSVVDDILQTFIMLSVINPIKNSLFGSIGGSLAPTLSNLNFGAAKGASFSGGVRMFAKGGLLNGPTVFGTSQGLAIGGEAGTEAVMPLRRGADGNLGVMVHGGANDNKAAVGNTYIIDARGADVGAVARIENALKALDRQIEGRALAATKDARTRNSRMAK